MLEVGETVAQYRVEALLGLGTVASVYRVRDLRAGSAHLLKVLVGTKPFDRERLLEEGRTQARLRHPNLVGVVDVLRIGEAPALVMEPVEGPSLDGWLAEGRISVDIALAVFRGIVTGVGVAHAVGLVHRALKPSSVLLGRGRSGAMVSKVTDFGLTWTGSVRATAYLAPEQLRDPRVTDVRSDLWALGCILYELVCGVPAFTGIDPQKLHEAVSQARYPDPQALLAPRSPVRVTEVIRDLLRPDPADRIESCAALWTRLWDSPVPRELVAEVTEPIEPPESLDGTEATHVWGGSDDEDAGEALVVPATLVPPEEEEVHDLPWPLDEVEIQLESATADWAETPAGAPGDGRSAYRGDGRSAYRSDGRTAAWSDERSAGGTDRRPAPPRTSGWWYLGAITIAGVPAGLFVLVVTALVLERAGVKWIRDVWTVLGG